MIKRSSGVLMHISSLPGKFGIGTFGKEAYQFVDFLEETKQSYWQILPLTTTSYGDSPYQFFLRLQEIPVLLILIFCEMKSCYWKKIIRIFFMEKT